MTELVWRLIARIVCAERIYLRLFHRAVRTPYRHIMSADGSNVYMYRFWLFNPYTESRAPKRWNWIPSIRLHGIMRADADRHLHDHPWNARTIVLRGWYNEERPFDKDNPNPKDGCGCVKVDGRLRETFHRTQGYTGRLLFWQYHRITDVPMGGAWTLFITWRHRGTWGFDVEGRKVPWREYLAANDNDKGECEGAA